MISINKFIGLVACLHLLASQFLSAQCLGDINIVTDPTYNPGGNHPYNPDRVNWIPKRLGTSTWEYFNGGNIWIDQPSGPVIQGFYANPFVDPSNVNVSFLASQPFDCSPDDGWELIQAQLGTASGAVGPLHTTHPVFVLYNKYKGLMRVFACLTHRENDFTEKAVVWVSHDKELSSSNRIGNALLSLAQSPTLALDHYNDKREVYLFAKPNYFANNGYYWMCGEFPILYDPCVCKFESKLRVGVRLIDEGDVDLLIDPQKPTTIVDANKNAANVNTFVGAVGEGVAKGGKIVESFNAAANFIEQNLLSGDETYFEQTGLVVHESDPTNPSTVRESTIYTQMKKTPKLPSWFKALPYVGYAYEIFSSLESFFGGGGKTETPDYPFVMIPQQKATGTISFQRGFAEMLIPAPGSIKGRSFPEEVPHYNNPIGVFNLTKTPKIKYIDYKPFARSENPISLNEGVIMYSPTLRSYTLAEPIKYIINPILESELEIVNMEAAFLFKPDDDGIISKVSSRPSPKIALNGEGTIQKLGSQGIYADMPYGIPTFGKNYGNSPQELYKAINEEGYEIDNWYNKDNMNLSDITFRTKFVPVNALEKVSFFIYKYGDGHNGFIENNPYITLKIRLTLKRKNRPDTKEIIQIVTFKVQVQQDPTLKPSPEQVFMYNFKKATNGIILQPSIDSDYWVFRNYYLGQLPIYPGRSSPGFYPNILKDYPNNLVLENVDLANYNNVFAWNTIVIGNNCRNTSSSLVTLRAGNEIIVPPSSTVLTNVLLIANDKPNEFNTTFAFNNDANLNCFDNNQYQPVFDIKSQTITKDPQKTVHLEAHPNPFNESTQINFSVIESGVYQLLVSDILGRNLTNLSTNDSLKEGKYQLKFDAMGYPSGIYFITLIGNNIKETIKVIKE